MPLSEFSVKHAKPREKPYKLSDGGGLYLLIQPQGSKLWRQKYRFGGKEKSLSFGAYPLIGIAEARRKRDDARKLLLAGVDPSAKRTQDKIIALTEASTTFGLIATEYLERLKDKQAAPATINKITWLLHDLASPLSKRPIKEITAAEILTLLRKIERSGRRETARRLRGVVPRQRLWHRFEVVI